MEVSDMAYDNALKLSVWTGLDFEPAGRQLWAASRITPYDHEAEPSGPQAHGPARSTTRTLTQDYMTGARADAGEPR